MGLPLWELGRVSERAAEKLWIVWADSFLLSNQPLILWFCLKMTSEHVPLAPQLASCPVAVFALFLGGWSQGRDSWGRESKHLGETAVDEMRENDLNLAVMLSVCLRHSPPVHCPSVVHTTAARHRHSPSSLIDLILWDLLLVSALSWFF